jgi:hypothetical protein
MLMGVLTGTYSMGNIPLKNAVDMAMPYMTPRSPVILISPLDGDFTLKEVVRELCSKKYNLIILSPSAIDFEYEITNPLQGVSPKYEMVKMERENLLTELRSYGANVVDWLPEKPVEQALQEVGVS